MLISVKLLQAPGGTVRLYKCLDPCLNGCFYIFSEY